MTIGQSEMNEVVAKDRIDALEAEMLQMPQVDIPVAHHFAPGIYAREIAVPAGTYIIGHAHKGPCMNMLAKGKMRIVDPDGMPRVIEAPLIFTSGPGRKAAHVLEDAVFINFHASDETDLDVLELQLIDKSDAWIAHAESQIALLKAEG